MGADTVSTHTVKNDATTTIVTRTTTIVSEHTEILAEPKETHPSLVEGVRKTLRDYWYTAPSPHLHAKLHAQDVEDDDDEDEEVSVLQDPTLLRNNSVIRRAYDYWRTLTQDADEAAKELVLEAKKARDEAAAEAKWAILGYKAEARKKFDEAELKYREALAAAERVHEEAHEKAKSKWFQAVDKTEQEVGEIKDQAGEITHRKWDRFKAAVNSLAYSPPKYSCSPSSQYWFSRQNPAADSGWDCREIWDHPSKNDHTHRAIKALPKKTLPLERVHDALTGLLHQAGLKAKNAPSATSFESSLKPVRDYYHAILDRVARNDQEAIHELDTMVDKLKAKLNEAKFYEEQTDSWLKSQWNAIIDNAGDSKDHYERVFKNSLKSIQNARTEAYNSLLNNLQRTINLARNNIREAVKATKDQADKSRVHKAVQEATEAFTYNLHEAEVKIKSAPKNAYDYAVETFQRDTAQLKHNIEKAAEAAKKSGASISHHASKSGSSAAHQASKSASSISKHASKTASSAGHQITDDAKQFVGDVKDKVAAGYDQASASVNSMWSTATPPPTVFGKVQHSYNKLLGDTRAAWFEHEPAHNDMNASSIYGALLALYFLFVARRIWVNRNLSRMTDPKEKTFSVVKTATVIDDDDSDRGEKDVAAIKTYKRPPTMEETLERERNSFGNVINQFTSVVPVTLILLVILDLNNFSRLALHSLFVGLVTSQILQGGLLTPLLQNFGMVDGVHATGREVGTYLSWSVMLLAAVANGVRVLHG